MQPKLWLLAAALAAVQAASATPDKPRIYFPRHVKRQFSNSTITRTSPFPPPDTSTLTTPTTLTTKREPQPQPIPDGTGSGGVTTVYVATETTIVTPSSSPTTVVSVGPAVAATPSSGMPPIVVLPSVSTPSIPDVPLVPTPSTSSSGILLAPTGPVTPTSSSAVESKSTVKVSSSPTVSLAPTAAPTGSSSPKPSVESSVTVTPAIVVTSSEPPKLATSVVPPPAENVTTTPVAVTSAPTSKPVSTQSVLPDPLSPIISILTSILPLPTPVNTTSSVVPPASTSPVESPVPVQTSSAPVVITSSAPVSVPPTSVVEPTTTTLPTSVPPPPPVNSTTEVPPTTVPPTTVLPPTSTPPPISTPPPVSHNVTVTSAPPPISTPPTGGNSGGISLAPNSTSSQSIIMTPPPTTTGPTQVPFTSVPATGTITDSESWLPTTMLVQVSSIASQPSQALAPTTTASLPSNLPQVISPNDPGKVTKPEDSVLAQIGFLQGLNYDFVSKNPKAAAQIFSYLPIALGYAGGIDLSKIAMTQLVPLDTSRSLGYFSTLARFYYPRSLIDTLRVDVKVPYSALYTNPDLLVYNLTQQINPAIEILPDDTADTSGPGAAPTGGANPAGDPFGGSSSSNPQTPQQVGTTAGIAVGAFGVAVAYGAAMFIIARRYKRKKQAHQRSSSVSHGSGGSSGMRYTGTGSPALMGGALLSRDFSAYGGVAPGGRDSHGSGRSGAGNSARTAYISAPVAAENSLGWN